MARHMGCGRDELRRPDRTEDPRLHLIGVAGGDVAELFVESRGTDRIANPSGPVHLHSRSAGERDVPVELVRHALPPGSPRCRRELDSPETGLTAITIG